MVCVEFVFVFVSFLMFFVYLLVVSLSVRQPVTLVIYDIRDDRLRFRVARFLRGLGLSRIQKSAFVGVLSGGLRSELEAGLRRILFGKSMYNVQIYTLTPAAYDNRVILSEGYVVEEEEPDFLI